MHQSNRSFNIPPGQPHAQLNFWTLACSNSIPSGQKSRSNAPPISTEIPLPKDKFLLQSNTDHASQREICRNDTFKLLLKTLLKELFANKGESLSCNPPNPAKTGQNHGRITLEQEINPVQFPHLPRQCSDAPLPGHDANASGGGGERMLKLRFDRYIRLTFIPGFSFILFYFILFYFLLSRRSWYSWIRCYRCLLGINNLHSDVHSLLLVACAK